MTSSYHEEELISLIVYMGFIYLMIVQLTATVTSAPGSLAFAERRRHSRHISTLKQQFIVTRAGASAAFTASVFFHAFLGKHHHFGLCDVKQSNKAERKKKS